MKFNIITNDNYTLYVSYKILKEFEYFKTYVNLQYIFPIIPMIIPVPYNKNDLLFIFETMEYYLNNPPFNLYYDFIKDGTYFGLKKIVMYYNDNHHIDINNEYYHIKKLGSNNTEYMRIIFSMCTLIYNLI